MKYLHYIILWAVILFILFFNQSNNDDKNTIYYKEINSDITKATMGSGSPSEKSGSKYNSGERYSRVYLSIPTEKKQRILKTDMGKNHQRNYLYKPNKNNQQSIKKNISSKEKEVTNDCTCEYKSDFIYNNEDFKNYDSDSIKYLTVDSFSTFAIDVDTVSYKLLTNFINNQEKSNIYNSKFHNLRIEEMINYFDYDYPLPEKETFNVITEISKLSFETDKYLLHIGIKGKEEKIDKIPPANLIFLIDTSWSMDSEHRLPLIKKSLIELTNNLRDIDKITILTYSDNASMYLNTTNGDKKDIITNKINELKTEGSTNGEAGLKLAYKTGEKTFIKGGINRIILCSDGGFNAGETSSDELKKMIVDYRKKEIALTTLAFSEDYFNDDLLKKISSSGNGNYYYINDFNEAVKVLSNQLTSTLNIIAKDVKIQVEFNLENIKSYKLIGYEENTLNTEDFNNDEIDANELGNGHSVTALYEIEFYDDNKTKKRYNLSTNGFQNELAVVNIRYKEPNEKTSKEVNKTINKTDMINDFKKTSYNYKFSLAVAYFGMILNQQIDESYINLIIKLAKISKGTDKYGYKEEFIQLVEKYKSILNPYDFYIEGDLTKDDLINTLTEKTNEFELCYYYHVKNNEEPIIQKKFQLKINNEGITYFTHIFNYNENNDSFENCLLNKLKAVKFPKKEKETFVNFNLNFNQKILNFNSKIDIYF